MSDAAQFGRVSSALFTDFYELTMAQGYWKLGRNDRAVFDVFFRRNPFGGYFCDFDKRNAVRCARKH